MPSPTHLPTTAEIGKLHRTLAPSREMFRSVWTHCQIVSAIAHQLLKKSKKPLDQELVRAGALLHDIGVYRVLNADGSLRDHYLKHGVIGAEILRKRGLPESVCRIAERHTGVGIRKEEIKRRSLPLPLKDYTAETPEERLVMYADKFHSKTPTFNTFAWYRSYVRQFGTAKVKRFDALRKEFGLPNLAPLRTRYRHPMRKYYPVSE